MTQAPMPPDGTDVVYFLRTRAGNVKIGTTRRLAQRLATHRREKRRPMELIGWARGGRPAESWIHRVLWASKVRGGRQREWFHPTPEVLEVLAAFGGPGNAVNDVLHQLHRRPFCAPCGLMGRPCSAHRGAP